MRKILTSFVRLLLDVHPDEPVTERQISIAILGLVIVVMVIMLMID